MQARLAELPERASASIVRTSNFVAQSTALRAKNKIRTGTRSGRIYQFDSGPHQASAPGEPPASLSGQLADSIRFTRMTDNLMSEATAGSDLAYARVLELGGINDDGQWVAARPFLFPSFLEAMEQAETTLRREWERGHK